MLLAPAFSPSVVFRFTTRSQHRNKTTQLTTSKPFLSSCKCTDFHSFSYFNRTKEHETFTTTTTTTFALKSTGNAGTRHIMVLQQHFSQVSLFHLIFSRHIAQCNKTVCARCWGKLWTSLLIEAQQNSCKNVGLRVYLLN
jgi:hypothetical protein